MSESDTDEETEKEMLKQLDVDDELEIDVSGWDEEEWISYQFVKRQIFKDGIVKRHILIIVKRYGLLNTYTIYFSNKEIRWK